MSEPDYLIIALRLPDVDGAIVCIPHGFGGLHPAHDLERFQARIRVASDPDDPARALHPGGAVGRNRVDDCMIYLAHHALFKARCEVHRASVDMYRSAHSGMLSLAEAVDLAERVGRLPRACNRTRLGLPCDRPAGAKGGPCPDCEAA